jgi:NAD(P)-dependent dehydrogenase (short-subunit alcohol dehydrogenase family)
MAYFVVTTLVLARLAPGARIVTVASNAHRSARLDFGDLQSRAHYSGFPVYAKSKLCNILFNRELARRAPPGVSANVLHPGFVATRFGDASGGLVRAALKIAKPIGAISPQRGAETIVYLASSPDVEGITGEYFTKCRLETPTAEARNDDDARRLWAVSADIAGIPAPPG